MQDHVITPHLCQQLRAESNGRSTLADWKMEQRTTIVLCGDYMVMMDFRDPLLSQMYQIAK